MEGNKELLGFSEIEFGSTGLFLTMILFYFEDGFCFILRMSVLEV